MSDPCDLRKLTKLIFLFILILLTGRLCEMNLSLSSSQIGGDLALSRHKSSSNTFLHNDSVDSSGVSPGFPGTDSSNKDPYMILMI